jgi:drug/metabolite transporter (DMT)-like permease
VAVCAAVCLIAWPIFEAAPWRSVPNWPASVWWSLALTGVVGAAAAFYIQTQVQRRLSAARTSVVLTMEPVFAALFGYLLAGDRLGLLQLAGGAVILGSLLIAELAASRREAKGTV